MKTKPTAADMLHERGYTFDPDILSRMYESAGLTASENIIAMHAISSVFIIDAYNAGREGKPLASEAPWLVKE